MGILNIESTKLAQWRDLVCDAQKKSGFLLNETMENYVVITLDTFITKTELSSSLIAIDFLHNIRIESPHNVHALRSVGDQCLLLAGLFPDRAKRKRVSSDYFMNLGKNAYYVLSYAALSHKMNRALYYQLFDNFGELIDVLRAMRG